MGTATQTNSNVSEILESTGWCWRAIQALEDEMPQGLVVSPPSSSADLRWILWGYVRDPTSAELGLGKCDGGRVKGGEKGGREEVVGSKGG